MAVIKRLADVSLPLVFVKVLLNRRLRSHLYPCLASIFYNFFFCQYRAALERSFNAKKQIPVSAVDHELDERIPFSPDWVTIYLDFVGQWVRMLGFLLERFGEAAWGEVADFMDSMGGLYRFAGQVYQKNLSTTRRPFYIRRLRFLVIHLFDPHLMCIPSLHVMVVILSYTRFARALATLDRTCSRVAEECRRRALDITEAILYVKQHSVNCVAAAMYAMTRFDPAAFPPEEAEDFASRLFQPNPGTAGLATIDAGTGAAVRTHIVTLYRHFLSRGREAEYAGAEHWTGPLLEFLTAGNR
jgi:hypothetical protein